MSGVYRGTGHTDGRSMARCGMRRAITRKHTNSSNTIDNTVATTTTVTVVTTVTKQPKQFLSLSLLLALVADYKSLSDPVIAYKGNKRKIKRKVRGAPLWSSASHWHSAEAENAMKHETLENFWLEKIE